MRSKLLIRVSLTGFGMTNLHAGSLGLLALCVGACFVQGQTLPGKNASAEQQKYVLRIVMGQRLFDSGCYETSENYFSDALEIHPHSSDALEGMEKIKQARAIEHEAAGEAMADLKRLQHKLPKIVLTEVVFDRTRLADAVDSLQRAATQADAAVDSDHQGVGIAVQFSKNVPDATETTETAGSPTETPPPPATADSPITLHLYQVPVFVAAQYVAAHVGMVAKLHGGMVCLVAKGFLFPEEILTREFRITPQSFALRLGEARTDTMVHSPETIDQILKAEGVSFPAGTNATYFPSTAKLIVHNSMENISMVESIVCDSIERTAEHSSPSDECQLRPAAHP